MTTQASLTPQHSTQSVDNNHYPASATPATSVIGVSTEYQQTSDFPSNTSQLDTEPQDDASYYDGISWLRIPGYGPCPDGLVDHNGSFIWKYGWRIYHLKLHSIHWLCRECHQKRRVETHVYNVTFGRSAPKRHLSRAPHCLDKDGPIQKKRRIEEMLSTASNASSVSDTSDKLGYSGISSYFNSFQPSTFKNLVLAWVIEDDHAFRVLESEALQRMFVYLNPAVERRGCMPCHGTVRNWINSAFDSHLGIVTDLLQSATSQIHISFDLWTSRSLIALAGINCHFLDKNMNYRTFLLSLPHQQGRHTGANIAETVAETIYHFGLQEKVGFFVTDNASNNDTCIAALAREFNFNSKHRRL